jgi:hypothetical protein
VGGVCIVGLLGGGGWCRGVGSVKKKDSNEERSLFGNISTYIYLYIYFFVVLVVLCSGFGVLDSAFWILDSGFVPSPSPTELKR